MKGESINDPDILIIPGSKNTIEDLIYLRESGLERQIKDLHKKGKLVFGICGGFQMLGDDIIDISGIETSKTETRGLGLIHASTEFKEEKTTTSFQSAPSISMIRQFQPRQSLRGKTRRNGKK